MYIYDKFHLEKWIIFLLTVEHLFLLWATISVINYLTKINNRITISALEARMVEVTRSPNTWLYTSIASPFKHSKVGDISREAFLKCYTRTPSSA